MTSTVSTSTSPRLRICIPAVPGGVFQPVQPDASAPATVFFTSGTTGGPKCVVVPHRAVTRLFGPGRLDGFGPGHATPQAAPVPWDMYAFELWGQLTSGGTSGTGRRRPSSPERAARSRPHRGC